MQCVTISIAAQIVVSETQMVVSETQVHVNVRKAIVTVRNDAQKLAKNRRNVRKCVRIVWFKIHDT